MSTPIHGWTEPRFDDVRVAFAENFESHGDVGAAVAVYLHGEPVVDLWGGWYTLDREREWDRNTLVNIASTTKGLAAFCAHRLIEQGLLDVDAPVAQYWPEFAAAGKAEMPVRYLLNHAAGLAAVREPIVEQDWYDWDKMTSLLAAQEPFWEPGEIHGYHAITFGWLVGEVVRRIDGRSLGTFWREEFAAPLGLDAHIGTGPEFDARIAPVLAAPPGEGIEDALAGAPDLSELEEGSLLWAAMANPPLMDRLPAINNERAWRAAEFPAANGHATARSLARIYGAVADGGDIDGIHVLNPETVEAATVEQWAGPEHVSLQMGLEFPMRFALGWVLNTEQTMPLGPNPQAFGHAGAGGSIGCADPESGIAFGYTMNQMKNEFTEDYRYWRLLKSVYAAL